MFHVLQGVVDGVVGTALSTGVLWRGLLMATILGSGSVRDSIGEGSDFWRLMDDEFGAGYSRVLAAPWYSPVSAAGRPTRPWPPAYRPRRCGWRCAKSRTFRPNAGWGGTSSRPPTELHCCLDRLTRRPDCSNICSDGDMLFSEENYPNIASGCPHPVRHKNVSGCRNSV